MSGWFITEEAGMRVHWLPVPYSNHMSHRARIRAFVKFAAGAARRAASLEGDVIFATSTPLTIALPAVYAARRQHIPMVFEVRDLWPELPISVGALRNPLARWAAHRLERFAYANAARLIALSPGMAAGVARAGYREDRITVVPNGSDLDLFRRDAVRGREFRQKLGIPEASIVVGYAGTLGRINGVSYLVHVAAALKADRRFIFVVVGDGQEREQIRTLARECAVLDQNFLMLPQLPKVGMPDVLSAFDIATSLFLPIPAMESNSANKFFDALAAGCCVAINHGGWQADLLERARAGFRLANDPGQAARDLQTFAEDPDRIGTAGHCARLLAEQRFSREELAARIAAVLTEAVAEAVPQQVH
jgi:glycosyltransferase involved in cell wall biosynthesis